MSDGDGYRTPAGREKALDAHEDRIDRLETRMNAVESKEASRDKRWNLALKTLVSLAVGIIGGIVVALAAAGLHP